MLHTEHVFIVHKNIITITRRRSYARTMTDGMPSAWENVRC